MELLVFLNTNELSFGVFLAWSAIGIASRNDSCDSKMVRICEKKKLMSLEKEVMASQICVLYTLVLFVESLSY